MVSSGLLADEAAALNRDFNWSIVQRRPWVVAKIALSLDGKITTPPGDDRWLTSPRRAAPRTSCAGNPTPSSSARKPRAAIIRSSRCACPGSPRGKLQPLRIVVTRSGKVPRSLHLFTDRHRDRTQVFRQQPLGDVLAELGAQHITHVLIEGGGQVLTEAFRDGLVNEVAFFIAPALMGTAPARAARTRRRSRNCATSAIRRIGPDLLCRGLVPR